VRAAFRQVPEGLLLPEERPAYDLVLGYWRRHQTLATAGVLAENGFRLPHAVRSAITWSAPTTAPSTMRSWHSATSTSQPVRFRGQICNRLHRHPGHSITGPCASEISDFGRAPTAPPSCPQRAPDPPPWLGCSALPTCPAPTGGLPGATVGLFSPLPGRSRTRSPSVTSSQPSPSGAPGTLRFLVIVLVLAQMQSVAAPAIQPLSGDLRPRNPSPAVSFLVGKPECRQLRRDGPTRLLRLGLGSRGESRSAISG
jgi:hypothetical protein